MGRNQNYADSLFFSLPPKPFIKWAGGKSQLLDQFKPLIPKKFNKYFEPFCGSAAVFFFLHTLGMDGAISFKDASLSDINEDLIITYQTVRDNVLGLIEKLHLLRQNHDKDHFYQIRSLNTAEMSHLDRAARFIYLNKTCFNGLYRVNSKGQFNVPIGSYKNPQIFYEKDLEAASKSLQNVNLNVARFSEVIDKVSEGDFVYFDPPYAPLSRTAYFTSYTKYPFAENEQVELSQLFRKLDQKGCKVMLSNSWVDFILDLYKDYRCIEVQASRAINSDPSKRGKISEVVVVNYDS